MAFWSKQKTIDIPKPSAEELYSMAEAIAKGGLSLSINNEIQKMVDASTQFQAYENADDQGNYFGSEFNIRATAGRIKGTYTREPWVFATATLIAKTLSTVPMIVVNAAGEPIPNHPLQKKLAMGNRNQDGHTVEWCGDLDLILCGNFFRVFNETFTEMMQIPAELVTLNLAPDRKTVESIKLWDNLRGQYTTTIPYKQVIQHKFPNPSNPYYGLSLFIAASRPILLDRFKNEFEMAFYLRGATNAGVIETTEDINKTRMERLMRTFEQVYTGKRNWWRTIFLPKGAKWVQSGLTMNEMQHLEGLRENRLTILATLGIPPSKVGLVQDVNRATSDNQDKDFWVNTIQPLANFIASGWNNSYLVKTIYGGQIKVIPDFSDVEVLQTSLKQKGEEAKAVEGYLIINELRELLGYPPLAINDPRGALFVSEIRAPQAQGTYSLAAPVTPVEPLSLDASELNWVADLKSQATASQERLEKKLGAKYAQGYEKYVDAMLAVAANALRNNKSPEKALEEAERELAKIYISEVEPTLIAALERGFSFANSQVKHFKTFANAETKIRFRDVDKQAIEALRDEQRDGQRKILVKRGIESFLGFNKTNTNKVLDIISHETEQGKTLEQIAAMLRTSYGEAYKDQAFTITRTEVLTAISQGNKWNHDVLGEVFSEVKKQWFTVGDIGSNPDARDEHYLFEGQGVVDSDYKYGGNLEYPRDPNGTAADVVNCRCSLVSVIPDSATSNADVILDNL